MCVYIYIIVIIIIISNTYIYIYNNNDNTNSNDNNTTNDDSNNNNKVLLINDSARQGNGFTASDCGEGDAKHNVRPIPLLTLPLLALLDSFLLVNSLWT